MMRIGIMCHGSCGGSSRVAVDLASELAMQGHCVHLISNVPVFFQPLSNERLFQCCPDDNALDKKDPSLLALDWPADRIEAMTDFVVDLIAEQKLDVLHIHYAIPLALVAARVKKRLAPCRTALIATLHGTDISIHASNPAMGSSLAWALDSMDAVTAVSKDLARQAAEVLRLSGQPMVIPNFLTPQRIKSKTAGLNEKPRILHASNFRPIKDPVGVALIFKEIRRRFESELWLVGQGRYLDRVRTVLKSNGIEKDTRYFGLQPDIADILSSGDLFLLPSLSESFGLAALEAMACGLPVLATEVGGLPEVVLHDRTGFLFPPGDYDSAAQLAVGLLSRPWAYQSMSHAAMEHARGFDPRKAVAMYEALYKDAIAAIRATGN